jgi:hypothetical protein
MFFRLYSEKNALLKTIKSDSVAGAITDATIYLMSRRIRMATMTRLTGVRYARKGDRYEILGYTWTYGGWGIYVESGPMGVERYVSVKLTGKGMGKGHGHPVRQTGIYARRD